MKISKDKLEKLGLFSYMQGYTDALADSCDGAYGAIHEEAVAEHSKEFGTNFDWIDIHREYFEWKMSRAEKKIGNEFNDEESFNI